MISLVRDINSLNNYSISTIYNVQLATAFMLAHPYGVPRIMSSYEYNRANNWEGPPHNGDFSIKDVSINSDLTCGNGWSCEHRLVVVVWR